ncbi:hypothetical protein ACFWH4_02145 [Streptomyces sp. NPDC127091]
MPFPHSLAGLGPLGGRSDLVYAAIGGAPVALSTMPSSSVIVAQ